MECSILPRAGFYFGISDSMTEGSRTLPRLAWFKRTLISNHSLKSPEVMLKMPEIARY